MSKNNAQSTQSKHVCDAQTSAVVDAAVRPHSEDEDVSDHRHRCDKNVSIASPDSKQKRLTYFSSVSPQWFFSYLEESNWN